MRLAPLTKGNKVDNSVRERVHSAPPSSSSLPCHLSVVSLRRGLSFQPDKKKQTPRISTNEWLSLGLPTDPDPHRHFKARVHINKNGLHFSKLPSHPTKPDLANFPSLLPVCAKNKHKLYLLAPSSYARKKKKSRTLEPSSKRYARARSAKLKFAI